MMTQMENLELTPLFYNHKTFQSVLSDYRANLFSHGYLFLSSDSTLVNAFALAVAQMLVCNTHTNCKQCEGCLLLHKQTHPDVLIYPKCEKFLVADSNSILEQVYIKPMISGTKVFVLNSFHLANEQSQNKLLKILEEPPKNVVFLLTASNESGVLVTVKSRLHKVSVAGFSEEQLIAALKKQTHSDSLIFEAIFASGGLLGNAVQYLQSKASQAHFQFAKKLICEMTRSTEILPYTKELSKDKEHFASKLQFVYLLLYKMLQAKENNAPLPFPELQQSASQFSRQALLHALDLVGQAKKQADSFVSLATISDKLLFGLLEVKYKWK